MPLTSGAVNRRTVIAAAALVASLGLGSCADTSSSPDRVVASVAGVELSQADLADIVDSDLGKELLQDGPVDGFIAGNSARGLISAWVGINSMIQAGVGAELDRADIETSLQEQFAAVWDSAPAAMKELAISNVVVGEMVRSGAMTSEDLQEIVSAADVTVDSRYGWWSSEQFSVQPLG
jgi:hypothetical protein